MEIPVDEDDQNVGNDCLACFPAGKTPKVIYASFSNVEMGALWFPPDPPPPNEMIELAQQVAACGWEGDWLGLHFWYGLAGPKQVLRFRRGLGPPDQFVDLKDPCARSFVNDNQVPAGLRYYGGQAEVFWTFPSGSPGTGFGFRQFGLPLDASGNTLVYPVDIDLRVEKFQTVDKNNKISIKRDLS